MLTFNGTSGLTFPDGTTQNTQALPGMRNRIINGDMRIDQRNNGASVTPLNEQYSLDRWRFIVSQGLKFTTRQNAGAVTPPAGFVNYLGVTSSSAYSVTSTDIFGVQQFVEGFNVADLGWGTANAQAVTLSFRVYSSLTGTFGGSVINATGTRSYPFAYTVASANTWTTASVTIPGDTSGTWAKDASVGLALTFGLGVGSTKSGTAGAWAGALYYSTTGATSVVGTSGATFYITGVQLEKGSTATPFEYRPYGAELALCQRYYEIGTSSGVSYGASGSAIQRAYAGFQAIKRATPTFTLSYLSGGAGVSGVANYDLNYVWVGLTSTAAGQEVAFSWTASSEL